jgi:chromosome segregation ATPase
MHPESPSGAAPDLVEALVARVEEIDAQLRATTAAIDEKSLREFRKTFETISKRDAKFEERLTDKVDVVADRLETITRTVSTTSAALAAKDGEIAQLRRELDAGSARLDSVLDEMRRGLDPTALDEVKRTVADLARQKLPRGLEGRIEELGAKLTMLAQRIDTVSSTVSTTAAGLAGRDGDVIALRRAHEAESSRIDSELTDLRRAVDLAPTAEVQKALSELRVQSSEQQRSAQVHLDETEAKLDALVGRLASIEASHDSTASRVSASEEHVSTLRAHLEEGSVNLSSLAATLAAMSERIDASDFELENVERRFHDATTRVDALIAELTQALAELPDPDSARQLLDARLSELYRTRIDDRVRIEEIADRLEAVALSADVTTGPAAATDALELRIDELAGLIDAATVERDETSGDVARLAALLDVERAAVRSRLESLAASHEGAIGSVSAEELELQVAAFDARIELIERERATQGARLERFTSAFDSERESFQTQLEALATALSWTSPKSGSDERIDELTRRMESLEVRSEAVAEKVAHATTLLPTALRSLEARLDELTPEPRGTTGVEPVSPLPRAPRSLLPSTFLADDELDEDDTPQRLPEPVVPIRGTDP